VTNAQAAGVPSSIFAAESLETVEFGPWLQVLLLQNVTVLSQSAADAVAKFAKAGGTVISSRDTGTLDELGRPRVPGQPPSLPQEDGPWGAGKIIFADNAPLLPDSALQAIKAASWQVFNASSNMSDWQFMSYYDKEGDNASNATRVILHCLYLGTASQWQPTGDELYVNGLTLELQVPYVSGCEMGLHSPVSGTVTGANSFRNEAGPTGGATLTLREPPVYVVVELNCTSSTLPPSR